MGRAKEKEAPVTKVMIKYDLFDLPTAQHKAGLAGLILQIRDMEERAKKDDRTSCESIPTVVDLTPTTATIAFTEKSVQGLMDDIYAAQVVEVAVKAKWTGQTPKREEVIEEADEQGNAKPTKRYIYDVIQPTGYFLQGHLGAERGAWLKLWRDMLWTIPRGNPQSRQPFEQRAAEQPCKEGLVAWKNLVKVEQARRKNAFHTADVAGSLWLGAQATNAELLPFEGRAEQNLLLHFWPLTTLIFVPQQIDVDGTGNFVGYVLAIPEVADLEAFLLDYVEMLGQLGTEVRGFRPAEAVIDLPAEGALAFLEHLARLSAGKVAGGALKYAVGYVEYLHLAKIGNNIKTLAAGRVAPRSGLLQQYYLIVGKSGAMPPYRNPFFRRGLLLALLNDQEWYEPMRPALLERPWPYFVRSERSPKGMAAFWLDSAKRFAELADQHDANRKRYLEMKEGPSGKSDVAPLSPLPLLIHRLVQRYVLRKTEEKSGHKWEDFKDKKITDEKTGKQRVAIPDSYADAKEKIASGTFLEMRSRREQDFVDHFTATFCSVPQYLPENEFGIVAEALLNDPDKVKTLTLLALSANS
jgi:CRISPR-associated protein Cmx8